MNESLLFVPHVPLTRNYIRAPSRQDGSTCSDRTTGPVQVRELQIVNDDTAAAAPVEDEDDATTSGPTEEVQISRPTKHTSCSSMHRIGILYLPLILRGILAFISIPPHLLWGMREVGAK